jgi:Transposase
VNDNSSATVMLGLEGMAVLAMSERLSEHAWARLLAGIDAGDDRGQVAKAWIAAQELRAIYRCRDRGQAAVRLYDWTVMCIDSGIAEIARLARTITT